MTEEEKNAVEIVKGLAVYYDDYSLLDEEEIEENESVNKSIELILNLIEKLQKELKQKDKIIDLMAETINNHDIDEDICKQMGQKANCNEFEDTEKCKECIKQYFINKAKEIR
jgi:hypothetical protein